MWDEIFVFLKSPVVNFLLFTTYFTKLLMSFFGSIESVQCKFDVCFRWLGKSRKGNPSGIREFWYFCVKSESRILDRNLEFLSGFVKDFSCSSSKSWWITLFKTNKDNESTKSHHEIVWCEINNNKWYHKQTMNINEIH